MYTAIRPVQCIDPVFRYFNEWPGRDLMTSSGHAHSNRQRYGIACRVTLERQRALNVAKIFVSTFLVQHVQLRETRHPVKGSFGSEFPAICNNCVSYGSLTSQDVKFLWEIFPFLGKTTHYGIIFEILFQKFSPPYQSKLLCSNFVKFSRREIGEIVRFLCTGQKISPASQTVATARIAPKIFQDQPPTI